MHIVLRALPLKRCHYNYIVTRQSFLRTHENNRLTVYSLHTIAYLLRHASVNYYLFLAVADSFDIFVVLFLFFTRALKPDFVYSTIIGARSHVCIFRRTF